MNPKPVSINLSQLFKAAVLTPVDPTAEVSELRFELSAPLPYWWSDAIGTVENGLVEICDPGLIGFLFDAMESWKGSIAAPMSSFLFESKSKEEPKEEPILIQALAGKQGEQCFLVLRDLDAVDTLFTKSLRAARMQMLDRSVERIEHKKEVADISADRDEANKLNQAKTKFLANMSHEIRTPLTTIMGMASMAQSTHEKDRQKECLDGVIGAARRLLRLSSDILDLSRIQAERLELDAIPFSLRQLLGEFERIWKMHCKERSLAFSVEIADETPDEVIGDGFRLQQILTNLVNNAMKFTERGKVWLEVKPNHDSAERILFCVHDTGVGIPKEQQSRIFDSFTQVDESPTRRHAGAGLGLAITSNLVRLMDSKLEVESEPGKGSHFFFDVRLPISADDSSANTTSEQTPSTCGDQFRVLVAEDHELNRSIIVEILENEGMEIVEAENGEVAVRSWREQEFDAVLMDCQMPVMSGIEAIELIRCEEPSSTRVPIIALTAHAMNEERQELFDRGADRYMSKPFEREELVKLLNSFRSF